VPEVLTFTRYKEITDLNIPAGTYVFNCQKRQTTGSESSLFTFYHNDTSLGSETFTASTLSRTMTFNDTITKIILYSQSSYSSSANIDITYTGLMLSKEGGDYVPYGCIEINKMNKNFAKEQFDQKLKITSSGNDRILEVANYNIAQIVPCKPSTTYVIDGDFSVFVDDNCRVRAFDNYPVLGVINRSTAFANGTSRFTITTDATSHYLFIYDTSDTRNLTVPNMFVCEQQYADTYVPHAEKTYYFPLSEGQKLMQDGTIDGKVKNTKAQVVFDGSNDEDWTLRSTMTNVCSFGFSNALPNGKVTDDQKAICSHFIAESGENDTEHCRTASRSYPEYFTIYIDKTKASTVEALRTWLASNPITVEYELATPSETNFTSEQQAVIDEIISDGTYKEVTHYTAEASINPDMEIGYYRDLPTIIENLENA